MERSRRSARHARPVLSAAVGLTLLLATGAHRVAAQEYTVHGQAELGAVLQHSSPAGVPAAAPILGTARAQLNHRLHYEWGEAGLRHAVETLGAGPAQQEQLTHALIHAAVIWWPAPVLTVQFGRFSLPWGVGIFFLPGDALHPARRANGDASGFDGLALTWTPSPNWTISAAARADTVWNGGTVRNNLTDSAHDLRWAAQLNGLLGATAAIAGVVYQPNTVLRPSAGLSFPLGPLVLHAEGTTELIGRAAGGIASPATEAVAQGRTLTRGDLIGAARGQAVAAGATGSVTLIEHSFIGMAEYQYLSAPPPEVGNHAVYAQLSWEWAQRAAVRPAVLFDPQKRRALVIPAASWLIADSLEFLFEAEITADESTGWRYHRTRLVGRVYF